MTDAINILITGDFCPINRVETLACKGDYHTVFHDFAECLKGHDLLITDLECPLSESEYRLYKTGPHQYAKPETIGLLTHIGVDLVVLANNHIVDLGKEGTDDTLSVCAENNISTIGLGETPDDARKYFVQEIKGKRVAILNFSDNEFLSTPEKSVQANPINPIQNFYDIQQANRENDFVIVIAHAGNEFYHLPSPRTKELYRFYVHAGAHAVVSHHTHCFSGYEVFQKCPIFYGLGNFLYDNPQKQFGDWNEGYVVQLKLNNKIEFEIIPLKQGNELPGVFKLNQEECQKFEAKLKERCEIIANDQLLEESFQSYCGDVSNMYDAFLEPYWGKYIHKLKSWGLFPRLLNKRKRLLYLNLIRCESHRDVLMRLLQKFVNS